MSIVCLHPENEPDALVVDVPDMQSEVGFIMEEQRKLHLVRCYISCVSKQLGQIGDAGHLGFSI